MYIYSPITTHKLLAQPSKSIDFFSLHMADQFLPGNFDQLFMNNFPFGPNILENPFPRLLDQLPHGNSDSFPGLLIHEGSNTLVPRILDNDSKRKATEEIVSSDIGVGRKNCGRRRGKRAKGKGEKEEEEREVIHVRARRGQATDSHSLAERVRREKINERLRCLQEIVPGCYKTMGMAVMFDEIINYVQSLQNQVEFLSMKLTAASTFYDFNLETDALETMQRAKAYEALKIQSQGEATGLGVSSAQFAPLGLDFGHYYPQLPHNK